MREREGVRVRAVVMEGSRVVRRRRRVGWRGCMDGMLGKGWSWL